MRYGNAQCWGGVIEPRFSLHAIPTCNENVLEFASTIPFLIIACLSFWTESSLEHRTIHQFYFAPGHETYKLFDSYWTNIIPYIQRHNLLYQAFLFQQNLLHIGTWRTSLCEMWEKGIPPLNTYTGEWALNICLCKSGTLKPLFMFRWKWNLYA